MAKKARKKSTRKAASKKKAKRSTKKRSTTKAPKRKVKKKAPVRHKTKKAVKPARMHKNHGGKIFMGFLFLGIGLGMLFDMTGVGALLGMGVGMLVISYLNRRCDSTV